MESVVSIYNIKMYVRLLTQHFLPQFQRNGRLYSLHLQRRKRKNGFSSRKTSSWVLNKDSTNGYKNLFTKHTSILYTIHIDMYDNT